MQGSFPGDSPAAQAIEGSPLSRPLSYNPAILLLVVLVLVVVLIIPLLLLLLLLLLVFLPKLQWIVQERR